MKKRRPIRTVIRLFIVAIVAIVIVGITSVSGEGKENRVEREPTRTEIVEEAFSSLNGAHIQLQRYIKSQMNDPKSYEHVETKYVDNGDYITVHSTFRGKNAFGGVVVNSVLANCSVDGEILEIVEWE